jgi:hypothetical protein
MKKMNILQEKNQFDELKVLFEDYLNQLEENRHVTLRCQRFKLNYEKINLAKTVLNWKY